MFSARMIKTVALVILVSVLKLTLNCQKTVSPDNIRCQFSLTCKCRLLITFANSLDPDQARHYVRPDLDPNC